MKTVKRAAITWNLLGPTNYELKLAGGSSSILRANGAVARSSIYSFWIEGCKHEIVIGEDPLRAKLRSVKESESFIDVNPHYLEGSPRRIRTVLFANVTFGSSNYTLICKVSCGFCCYNFRLLNNTGERCCCWEPSSCNYVSPSTRISIPARTSGWLKVVCISCAIFTTVSKDYVDAS